jgi:hypothetical protein
MELITNVGLIMIPELIFVVTRYPHNCVPGLIVRELFTSSGIPNIIMTWLAPLIALPAPFIYASFHPASHVATATIFLCNAAATGACFEFLIAKLLVQLSNYVIIGQLNVAGLSLVHFQLAFEADRGITFSALDLGGPRVWCTDPFLAFYFRAYHHQRIILIFDVIFKLSISL